MDRLNHAGVASEAAYLGGISFLFFLLTKDTSLTLESKGNMLNSGKLTYLLYRCKLFTFALKFSFATVVQSLQLCSVFISFRRVLARPRKQCLTCFQSPSFYFVLICHCQSQALKLFSSKNVHIRYHNCRLCWTLMCFKFDFQC